MRRKTLKFIEGGRKIPKRQILYIGIAVAAVLLLGAAYLIYSHAYGNTRKITLESSPVTGIEKGDIASENNIVPGYLFSRTKKLMLENASDGVLIPSSYRIAGRLVTQPAEESGVYLLTDQALLLKAYVRAGERSAAIALKSQVNDRFLSSTSGLYCYAVYSDDYEGERTLDTIASNTCNIEWLDAYLEFYSVYGGSDDYDIIYRLSQALFDEEGNPVAESLTVARYVESAMVSEEEVSDEPDEEASLDTIYGSEAEEETEASVKTVEGVKLSDVKLRLIYNLEQNDIIAEGAYENALEIVKGALATENIPLYAYAYEYGTEGINYIYAADEAGTMSVTESLKTMRNLAEMGQLDSSVFALLSQEIINDGLVYDRYYLTTGNYGQADDGGAYADALELSYYMEDESLFALLCNIEGRRVASKSSSDALYMIFRQDESRYDFYAAENLGVYLATSSN